MFIDIFDPFYLYETSLVICSNIPPITSLSCDSDPIFFSRKRGMGKYEFNQWFTGFSDAEGCFYFSVSQMGENSVISFKFSIHPHLHDIETLEFIKANLDCGVISISRTSISAKLETNKFNDIRTKLLPLFDEFPLNGVKYLDYLAFKKGMGIKLDKGLSKQQKWELIGELKKGGG
jgi:hypothetical protein